MDTNMSKHSLFNSFLLAVCLAVMGWVAHKAADSGERIAAMQASLDAVKESASKAERASTESLARMERKMDDMVPRREFDAKMLAIETEQRKADIRLREIDLEILKLKDRIR
ncbi:MAG TPA: hypothetical protein VK530_08560 [Candidatus Acidoferrum sp.]|nr:hypothetical protein [Candidatus Acidoferrum sp.]